MSEHYSPVYPASLTDASIKQWIIDYYREVDTDGAVDSIADYFTDDASVAMGASAVKGREDLIKFLHSTWDYVAARQHHLEQVFPFGDDPSHYMIYGTVTYHLKDGRSAPVQWAGVSRLVQVDGKWKMHEYKVYFAANPAF